MNQEYKKIKQELYRQSPRFRQRQTQILIGFLLKLFLMEALIIAFAIGAYAISPGAGYSCIGVGILVFWLLIKKSKFFKYRFLGKVTDIRRESKMVDRKGYARSMRSQVLSIFTVTDENGNRLEIELPVPYEKVFKKGDKIIRLAGMKYPVDLTPEELLVCPFCGNIFPTENEVCVECGEPALNASVIDSIR
ncbi:MAG: hypothetical protein E7637_09290 [Ruminococcaceae bacterium]|nr:hypothetical protein [Oscillospiraceae bacterium]